MDHLEPTGDVQVMHLAVEWRHTCDDCDWATKGLVLTAAMHVAATGHNATTERVTVSHYWFDPIEDAVAARTWTSDAD